jgi:hypothetical protein
MPDRDGTHTNSHSGLHSEQGALPGEHPGRARNPLVKVHDLAWLEFTKPDLARAEAFAHAFGFTTALLTDDELHLRGTDPGAPCVLVRRGAESVFAGPAFRAADAADAAEVTRLANAAGTRMCKLDETLGGIGVSLHDLADTHELAALPPQTPQTFNFGHELNLANRPPRPPREPGQGAAARARRADDHEVPADPRLVPRPPRA